MSFRQPGASLDRAHCWALLMVLEGCGEVQTELALYHQEGDSGDSDLSFNGVTG